MVRTVEKIREQAHVVFSCEAVGSPGRGIILQIWSKPGEGLLQYNWQVILLPATGHCAVKLKADMTSKSN